MPEQTSPTVKDFNFCTGTGNTFFNRGEQLGFRILHPTSIGGVVMRGAIQEVNGLYPAMTQLYAIKVRPQYWLPPAFSGGNHSSPSFLDGLFKSEKVWKFKFDFLMKFTVMVFRVAPKSMGLYPPLSFRISTWLAVSTYWLIFLFLSVIFSAHSTLPITLWIKISIF